MHVPTGRYEKRTARAVTVEVLRLDESHLNNRAVTENVSPRGALIVTDCNCAPGKHVCVTVPEEGVKSLARVVYCQRLESTKFAVGFQLAAISHSLAKEDRSLPEWGVARELRGVLGCRGSVFLLGGRVFLAARRF